ncbi:cytochrome P450 [Streptomyces sp. NPDC014733]|uniref:cytochrome P450 n=1 Tax=Streptomyces sp. NPDC014733 TaxID=3364885 RepID=UPI00370267DA
MALTTTLQLLAEYSGQWEHLRTGRATADQAFAEALRLEAPIQAFGRRVTADTALAGTQLRGGDKLWVLYGSAGRDRRHWGPDADEFRVRRTGHGSHLAFGAGPHTCVGLHLAQLQARALIDALATRCTLIRPAGTPVRLLNHLLRGFSRLPLTVEPV